MTIHSKADLDGMQKVGLLVGQALHQMQAAVCPGMTTAELDQVGVRFLRAQGARSAPQMVYGFPGFNCISVNDEIVHGVPGPRVLRAGDVVKVDVTAELGGYIADAAVTVVLRPAGLRASLPFEPGPNKRVAVKVIDDRGIESLKLVDFS